MSLKGITFTSAEGETIALDKDYITEKEHSEIMQLRNDEIKERTFRKNITSKHYLSDYKNGKVIKWSKERIWRENIMQRFVAKGDDEIKSLEHAIIFSIRYFSGSEFNIRDIKDRVIKLFATIEPGDDEETSKQKLLNLHTINSGIDARFTRVYYAFGVKGIEKVYDDPDKYNQILLKEDPLMIRFKKDKLLHYKLLPKFFELGLELLYKIYEEYSFQYNQLKNKDGMKVRDININVRDKVIYGKINESNEIEVINVESKSEPAPAPAKQQTNVSVSKETPLSEKTRITYYIIDKIFANPKPGTTMVINNDASIEFKF